MLRPIILSIKPTGCERDYEYIVYIYYTITYYCRESKTFWKGGIPTVNKVSLYAPGPYVTVREYKKSVALWSYMYVLLRSIL